MTEKRILVVDDEEAIRKLLAGRFAREGWTVDLAESGTGALEMAVRHRPLAVVTDIKMPGLDGFQLIEALGKAGVDCPVIVITGHGEKECAMEALHKGAFDYLEKPFDMDEIASVVRRAIEREELRRANTRLMSDLEDANKKLASQLEMKSELLERVEGHGRADETLIGGSEHIRNLRAMVQTIAESFRGKNDPVVLIVGESGVGKEVVARHMHDVTFAKEKPFVAVNCAAFPDNLLESELFGYEKGAFTGAMSRKLGLFELASGGTLFLDEIGEMDLKMQAKLLRVLQERVIRRLGGTADIPIKPHIIAATNRDLGRAVAEKTFREDLYYRLNTIPISVAPLRSRPGDIEELANFFLKALALGRGKKFTGFSPNAMRALRNYSWPGNVRELRSVIERAVILEKGPVAELSHLRQEHLHAARLATSGGGGGGFSINTPQAEAGTNGGTVVPLGAYAGNGQPSTAEGATGSTGEAAVNFPEIFEKGLTILRKEMDEHFVRQVLIQTLTRERGNVSAVARSLRLDRANLLRMLKRFAIEPELFRAKAS